MTPPDPPRPDDPGLAGVPAAPLAAPAWAARAVLGVAVLAGGALVGQPAGLGLVAVLFALGLIGGLGVARGRTVVAPVLDLRLAGAAAGPAGRDWWRVAWWALCGALACLPALRAAGWVVVAAVATAAAVAALAVAGGARWGELLARLPVVVARMPAGALLAGRGSAAGVSVRGAAPAARGAVIAGALLAVFLPLLLSADAAFAEVLQSALPAGWAVDQPVARLVAALAVAGGGGALLHAGLRPPAPAARPARLRLGRLDGLLPLAVLVALLGGFVVFQLATLFGGNRHVLATAGLTYAEYARSGFAQLMVVAALVLAVVAAANRWAGDDGWLLRGLLTALCLLTLVMLASAVRRLHLYEEAYGFTRLRLAADAALLWLGALFCLVLAARAGAAAWLPRAAIAVTAGAVLVFGLSDPERRIADRNIDRYERTGKLDTVYLATLGPDAAPALARLPATSCVTARLRTRLATPDGLVGLNLARTHARQALSHINQPKGDCPL